MTTAPCRQHNGPWSGRRQYRCSSAVEASGPSHCLSQRFRVRCGAGNWGLETGGPAYGEALGAHPEFYGPRLHQWEDVGPWLRPNFKKNSSIAAGSDLRTAVSPHRYYRRWLKAIAPVYLIGGCGYEEALLRLLDIACLTQRLAQAEACHHPDWSISFKILSQVSPA